MCESWMLRSGQAKDCRTGVEVVGRYIRRRFVRWRVPVELARWKGWEAGYLEMDCRLSDVLGGEV